MSEAQTRILLIEDNPGDVRLIQEKLPHDGPNRVGLEISQSLGEGLERLAREPFDVMLLDLSLPDSKGMDTVRTARRHAPSTAIVVLTGTEDVEIGVQAIQAGAQDYLPKAEADTAALSRSIRHAIERHRAEMALRQSQAEYRSLIDDVFESSTVGVIIFDRTHKIVWANEVVKLYFGLDPAAILGMDKISLIQTKLRPIFENGDEYVTRLLHAYEHDLYTDRFECHVEGGQGIEERWLYRWSQPIRSGIYAGGRVVQYTDITERKRLEVAEREQRHLAEALRDIGSIITSTLNMNEVLEIIFKNLGRIVPYDSAVITILEGEERWAARRRNVDGEDQVEVINTADLQLDITLLVESMAAAYGPVIINDIERDGRMRALIDQTDVRAYLGTPIIYQGDTIGYFNLLSLEPGGFSRRDGEKLAALAEQAAVAIQNARLFQQTQELAALEERQRLARDLHDSVSQTLFTCRTLAESALRRWERDPTRAHELLEEVHHLTGLALNEMRVLLLELRPHHLTRLGLKELFVQYLLPIQERRGFTLEMDIDDIAPLPGEVQISLYRIAQEILNNIDKHALANQVHFRVWEEDEAVRMAIRDDGRGFNPDGLSETSFGMGIMQERAEKIGAALQIQSAPGAGTDVAVSWPRRRGGMDGRNGDH